MIREEDRLCVSCEQPIPLKRLAVVPEASQCVECLTINGDVPLIRRHDDHVGKDGEEVVQSYFKDTNQYLGLYLSRMLHNSSWALSKKPDEDASLQLERAKNKAPNLNDDTLYEPTPVKQYNHE